MSHKSRRQKRGACDGEDMQFKGISALILGVWLAISPAMADQEVRNVRFGVDGERTRVVIETSEPADFRAFTLDGLSDRLVVDLPETGWAVSGLETGEGVGHGLVDEFRFFSSSSNQSRVVFELEHPAVITAQFALAPAQTGGNHRLVIDMQRAAEDQFRSASGFEPAGSSLDSLIAERVDAVYTPPLRARRVIVIDAGHGGRDPGAISSSGVREKDVTLSAARELQRQLEATGRYDVFMTREGDTYPEWEDRVGVMRDVQADLFLSLHADAARNSSVRGAAVYTLNDRAENRARARARRDANHSRQAEVNNILVELELREKRNQSTIFADVLLEHLDQSGRLLTNPHREENFFVLLDSRVPTVLIEMGFLTNSTDVANLTSPSFRRRQMGSIVSAIDYYFLGRGDASEERERTAALIPAR